MASSPRTAALWTYVQERKRVVSETALHLLGRRWPSAACGFCLALSSHQSVCDLTERFICSFFKGKTRCSIGRIRSVPVPCQSLLISSLFATCHQTHDIFFSRSHQCLLVIFLYPALLLSLYSLPEGARGALFLQTHRRVSGKV